MLSSVFPCTFITHLSHFTSPISFSSPLALPPGPSVVQWHPTLQPGPHGQPGRCGGVARPGAGTLGPFRQGPAPRPQHDNRRRGCQLEVRCCLFTCQHQYNSFSSHFIFLWEGGLLIYTMTCCIFFLFLHTFLMGAYFSVDFFTL